MRKKWIKILAILICFATMAVVNVSADTTITTNQTGTHDGYYYSFWTDGAGSVNLNLGPGGNYSVTWSNCGNFICGKGWNTGSDRAISYSGSFNGGSDGYLSVYGWTTNPLVEYYIVENYGVFQPPGGISLAGTMTSDGGTYRLYRAYIPGYITMIGADYYRYWSIRVSKRSSGTVTLKNHFDAWKSKGWNLGTFNYQIMAVEGYQSTGSANITVSEGPINPTPTFRPTSTPSTTTTQAPTPTPTQPEPTPSRNYIVTYAIQSDWGAGATINVTIKNNTTTAVNGWTLAFTFPGNQTITNLWNGTYTQSGAFVLVKNASGNAIIPAGGGSVNFGFNLKYSGTNAKSASFTLNGAACTVQ